jgi:hypothetical protein
MTDSDGLVFWYFGAAFVIILLVSFFIGWMVAHSTVSKECERLNSFYVGTAVYECKVRGLK